MKITIGFLLASWCFAATPTLVNSGANSPSGTNTATVATGAISVTAGNLLVACVSAPPGGGTMSVTDTAGNTFTGMTIYHRGDSGQNNQIFYAKNVTGNASDILTAHVTSATNFWSIVAAQIAGASTTAPADADSGGGGTSATPTTTYSTKAPNEIIIACAPGTGFNFSSVGTGYTLVQYDGTIQAMEYKGVTAIQTNATATFTIGGSVPWVISAASFLDTPPATGKLRRFAVVTNSLSQ